MARNLGSGTRTKLRAAVVVASVAMWAGSGCVDHSGALPAPTVRPVQTRSPAQWSVSPVPGMEGVGQSPAGWAPPAELERPGRWQGIVVHHSATRSGNAAEFHRMHQQRVDASGEHWIGLGYHFVINNGRGGPDGQIEVGFRWRQQMQGAHCRPRNCADNYWNEHTIGICLVGNFELERPTQAQYEALARLVRFMCDRYSIPQNRVLGHGQVHGANTRCPGRFFSWQELRRRL